MPRALVTVPCPSTPTFQVPYSLTLALELAKAVVLGLKNLRVEAPRSIRPLRWRRLSATPAL